MPSRVKTSCRAPGTQLPPGGPFLEGGASTGAPTGRQGCPFRDHTGPCPRAPVRQSGRRVSRQKAQPRLGPSPHKACVFGAPCHAERGFWRKWVRDRVAWSPWRADCALWPGGGGAHHLAEGIPSSHRDVSSHPGGPAQMPATLGHASKAIHTQRLPPHPRQFVYVLSHPTSQKNPKREKAKLFKIRGSGSVGAPGCPGPARGPTRPPVVAIPPQACPARPPSGAVTCLVLTCRVVCWGPGGLHHRQAPGSAG